jgi:hypothetical protein
VANDHHFIELNRLGEQRLERLQAHPDECAGLVRGLKGASVQISRSNGVAWHSRVFVAATFSSSLDAVGQERSPQVVVVHGRQLHACHAHGGRGCRGWFCVVSRQ